MKLFRAIYSNYRNYYTEYIACIVKANTESEALGMALGYYEYTDACNWILEEIIDFEPGVEEMLEVETNG